MNMIGVKLTAKKDFLVEEHNFNSIPPLSIKEGDTGVITGIGDYDLGEAYEININGEEIFAYGISSKLWVIEWEE